jgi:hypothetical protein
MIDAPAGASRSNRVLDTYRLIVSHNDFKKVYRAKHVLSLVEGTPSTQSKESNGLLRTLAAFAPLRE